MTGPYGPLRNHQIWLTKKVNMNLVLFHMFLYLFPQILEHPQLYKLQLCKELNTPLFMRRSNNYSADGHDALKLYE